MIPEAINTAVSIGWAIAAWIVLTSLFATLGLYAAVVMTWAVGRGVWRAGRAAWRALRKRQAPASGAESTSCDSRDANNPQRPAQRRAAPSWARAEHDHQEAA